MLNPKPNKLKVTDTNPCINKTISGAVDAWIGTLNAYAGPLHFTTADSFMAHIWPGNRIINENVQHIDRI